MAAWLMMVVILMRGLRPVALRIVTGLTVVVPPLVGISALSVLTRERFLLEAGFLWSTLDTRVQLMTSGVRLWAESPWFGIGLNQFRHVHKQRGTWAAWAESPSLWGLIPTPDYLTWPAAATDVAHAHNTLLQTALDTGVIGLAAYLGILAFLLVQAARASRSSQVLCRRVALGSFLSLVAVTAFGLADALALGSKIGAFQWMAAGLILGALRVQSDTNGHAPRRR
jgi:O-antigen ligase